MSQSNLGESVPLSLGERSSPSLPLCSGRTSGRRRRWRLAGSSACDDRLARASPSLLRPDFRPTAPLAPCWLFCLRRQARPSLSLAAPARLPADGAVGALLALLPATTGSPSLSLAAPARLPADGAVGALLALLPATTGSPEPLPRCSGPTSGRRRRWRLAGSSACDDRLARASPSLLRPDFRPPAPLAPCWLFCLRRQARRASPSLLRPDFRPTAPLAPCWLFCLRRQARRASLSDRCAHLR